MKFYRKAGFEIDVLVGFINTNNILITGIQEQMTRANPDIIEEEHERLRQVFYYAWTFVQMSEQIIVDVCRYVDTHEVRQIQQRLDHEQDVPNKESDETSVLGFRTKFQAARKRKEMKKTESDMFEHRDVLWEMYERHMM